MAYFFIRMRGLYVMSPPEYLQTGNVLDVITYEFYLQETPHYNGSQIFLYNMEMNQNFLAIFRIRRKRHQKKYQKDALKERHQKKKYKVFIVGDSFEIISHRVYFYKTSITLIRIYYHVILLCIDIFMGTTRISDTQYENKIIKCHCFIRIFLFGFSY